ncbi:MAG TPA: GNAT family N-acetyltransferase [Fimbriimonadaceae bacterium]|nr:GNAT family N-acetyltransferase [Fimbriimonadaceae bacterium]
MEFRIREATNADVEGIVGVVKAVYDEYGFTWDAEEYHADLYDPDEFYWRAGDQFFVAEDGEIRGVIGLCFHDLIPGEPGGTAWHEDKVRAAGSDCSLERLYVHPEARRRGIGEALTREVIERAKREGKRAMELWSDKRFGDAHRLYGRFGAATIGERICHDPDQSPEWGLLIRL